MTHRTFISIILAAALAITGTTSTPARAGNDDVAKWIAGAVAIGIIGAAIAEKRKDDRARSRAQVPHQHQHRHDNSYPRHDRPKKKVYHDHRFNNAALPEQCRRVVDTRRGEVRGFGQRCLLNNYRGFNALPHNCAITVRGYNGQRRVIYGDHCLQSHGYRMAGNYR